MELLARLFGCCHRHWDAIPLRNENGFMEEDATGLLSYHSRHCNSSDPTKSPVHLDLTSAGHFAVVLKNNTRLCGSGGARANAPILQDKAYFEVRIQTSGAWAVGLCLNRANLNSLKDLRSQSSVWVLYDDGNLWHHSMRKATLEHPVEEGDVIGIFYDHAELAFAVNGLPMRLRLAFDNAVEPAVVFVAGFTGVRGTVFPVFSTDEGAILDVRFSNFHYPPPEASGFTEIRLEHDII